MSTLRDESESEYRLLDGNEIREKIYGVIRK
jgi:hypothetical protein